jgi:hypothetical protein
MNHEEAVILCRFTKSVCPQQAFDAYTPDAWALVLADIRMVDAKEAVVAIKRRQPWVDPSEIIAEVKRIRRKRIDEYGPIVPPPDLDPDNTTAYTAWWVGVQRAIADGEMKPAAEVAGVKARPMKQIEGTFRRPQ